MIMRSALVLSIVLLFVQGVRAIETSGKDYRLSLEGEKTFHFEQRMAESAPIGFYPGADRSEALRLAINGELYERFKISGEMENAGQGDAEDVLWLALSGKQGSVTLGKFNAAFPDSRLFLVNRKVDGGQLRISSRFADAEALVSRPGGAPFYEKFLFAGPGVYVLKNTPVLFQSEFISVNGEALERGRDYQMEYNTGRFYLTPRFLSTHAIADGQKGALVRVAYEAANSGNKSLAAMRLIGHPLRSLSLGVIGLQEQSVRADSTVAGGSAQKKMGLGGLVCLNRDSLAHLNGEIGVQKETGAKQSKALCVDGGVNFQDRFRLNGEYEAFDSGYTLQGNSGTEPGLVRAKGAGTWHIASSATAEGEYSAGRFESGDGDAEEKEAFGRLSVEPEKLPGLKVWGRNRETRSTPGLTGNTFLHAEADRKFGDVTAALGGEYEKFYGELEEGAIAARSPYFVKLYASRREHVNYNAELNAEQLLYSKDTLGNARKEWRGGASGTLSANYPGLDLSGGGVYSAAAGGGMEGAVEGRAKASSWHDRVEVSGQMRDALEHSPDTAAGGAGTVERKTLVQGSVRLCPLTPLSLSYAPLLHLRRNQTLGADILRETRHEAGLGLSFKPVKWNVDGALHSQRLSEISHNETTDRTLSSSLDLLLPGEVNARLRVEEVRGEEEENSPVTGSQRGKTSRQRTGEIRSTMAVGRSGNAGLSAGWSAFRQDVKSVSLLDLDSSTLNYASVKPENELFLFADRTERKVTADYTCYREKWEAGVSTGLLYQTDRDSSDGRRIGARTTRGVLPEVKLEYRPVESLSAQARLSGAFQSGYRSTEKYSLECSFSFSIRMFTFCGSATGETEKTPAFYSSTLLCFFDMSMKI